MSPFPPDGLLTAVSVLSGGMTDLLQGGRALETVSARVTTSVDLNISFAE